MGEVGLAVWGIGGDSEQAFEAMVSTSRSKGFDEHISFRADGLVVNCKGNLVLAIVTLDCCSNVDSTLGVGKVDDNV